MIDIDPTWYFHPSFLLAWRCPRCREPAPVPRGSWRGAHCPACAEPLSGAGSEPTPAATELRSA